MCKSWLKNAFRSPRQPNTTPYYCWSIVFFIFTMSCNTRCTCIFLLVPCFLWPGFGTLLFVWLLITKKSPRLVGDFLFPTLRPKNDTVRRQWARGSCEPDEWWCYVFMPLNKFVNMSFIRVHEWLMYVRRKLLKTACPSCGNSWGNSPITYSGATTNRRCLAIR